ncbi:MAG TPA: hypothetical protein ENJ62_06370 [Bryobacterales bacterium]|nr:hypothetical protein [Bryobacterales bacterium]
MRLLALLGALALVIFLMREARRPVYWAWIERMGRPAPAAPQIDTRFHERVEVASAAPNVQSVPRLATQLSALGPAPQLVDVWAAVLKRLPLPVRRHFEEMVALAAKRPPRPSAIGPARVEAYLADIDRAWQRVEAIAAEREMDVHPAIRLWRDARAALQRWAAGEPVGVDERHTLRQTFSVLLAVGCRAIRDNARHRPEENHAWYLLQHALLDEWTRPPLESTPRVSYVQLFSEPDAYRCRPVRMRGEVRLIERLNVQTAPAGISHIFRLWMRPAGGPNEPVVVYCLSLPRGLPPPSADAPPGRQPSRRVRAEVEVAGFFFKRWVYTSRQGARLAPLILAYEPWVPPRAGGPDARHTGTVLLSAIAVAALGSAVLSLWLWRRTPHAPPRTRHRAAGKTGGEHDQKEASEHQPGA